MADSGSDGQSQSASRAVNLSSGPTIATRDVASGGNGEPQEVEKRVFAYLPVVTVSRAPTELERYNIVAQRLLALVNKERQRMGCLPLVSNIKLARAAQSHTQDMADHKFLGHQGSDGSWPHERVRREGYRYSYIGETLAQSSFDSADHVFSLWMNSPDHREIILSCTARKIGIGYIHPYWTLVLAKQT